MLLVHLDFCFLAQIISIKKVFLFVLQYWRFNSILLGKHSTTWTMAPVLLLLICFSNRVSCFCLDHPWTSVLLPLPPQCLRLQVCTITLPPIRKFFHYSYNSHSYFYSYSDDVTQNMSSLSCLLTYTCLNSVILPQPSH
jgi:hypothetical protein